MGNLGKLLFVTLAFVGATRAWSEPQVPCFNIFGDSLVDNGNNNRILTVARANYRPYGVDFPEGASGRFTNGRTMVDILTQLLGFRSFIPPYALAREDEVLRGFNYASGAAGIRVETGDNLSQVEVKYLLYFVLTIMVSTMLEVSAAFGSLFEWCREQGLNMLELYGEHYPFSEQINHFRNTVQFMRRMFRGNNTKLSDHLSKCIYFVGMGSNDYLNNYFMPFYYPTSYEYSPSTFAALLLQDYSRQLTELYNLGARKVAIIGIGQVGCIPYELARNRNGGYRRNNSQCNETINNAITTFNNGLVRIVNRFNRELSEAKFIYVNIFESSKDIAAKSASYGFRVTNRGCCGVGRNNGQITCLPYERPCSERTKYLFWDAFHPTEAANIIYARKAYSSKSKSIVYPMNIQQLAMA